MKCKNCNKEIECVNCHYFDQRLDPVSFGANRVMGIEYAFEKLGMTEFIEVAEEEKQIDNTKR